MFENLRHGVDVPDNLFTVDFREVFKTLFPDAKKTSLAGYFEHVTGKDSIPDAHTALGDARALKVICDTVEEDLLWQEIEQHQESWDSVRKRCLK